MELLSELFTPIQLIGYAGMLCAFLSYQCKKNTTYFILQAACGGLFALQFLLMGGWAGFFLNLLSIARGVLFGMGDKCRKWYVLFLVEAGFVLCSALSLLVFGEPWWILLLLLAAQTVGTLAMWTHNGKTIRLAQFCFVSPVWIFHNSFYKFSLGGVLSEAFNMLSILLSFLRFKRTGFDRA